MLILSHPLSPVPGRGGGGLWSSLAEGGGTQEPVQEGNAVRLSLIAAGKWQRLVKLTWAQWEMRCVLGVIESILCDLFNKAPQLI